MKINRNNYEVFLIDYLDGTLDAILEAELLLFLEENPDIREEFEGLETVSLSNQKISFDDKSILKKTEIKTISGIGENNFEDFFIAFYEDDLSSQEAANLKEFLNTNPQLQTDFALHKKLLLQKEETLVYAQKEELKKKPVVGIWWISTTGIAAAIVLLFALFNLLKQGETIQVREQLTLIHLNPKSVTAVSIATSSFIIASRNKQVVQKEIQAVELLAFETNSISKLNSKNVDIILSGKADYIPIVRFKNNNEILARAQTESIREEKKKGVLGRVLNRNMNLLAELFTKNEKNKSDDPTFVKILDGGITAFNTVTGSEVELRKDYDKAGNLKAYQIEGEMLNVNRSIPGSGNAE